MFWGERKIGEETYLQLNLPLPNGAARGGAAIFWLAVDLELNQSTGRHFTGME